MISGPAIVALDVGGSSIKSGAVMPGHGLLAGPRHTPIDPSDTAEEIVETLCRAVRAIRADTPAVEPCRLALAIPGPFDYREGIARFRGVSKFDGLHGLNLRAALATRLGLASENIRFRNDAEAAVVGAWSQEPGCAKRRVAGITLGTGLGAAFLDAGCAIERPPAPAGGVLWDKPFRGRTADDVFSTRGVVARFALAGHRVGDAAEAAALAQEKRPGATELWREFGRELGEFLTPHVVSFRAERLLMLGGIARAEKFFGPALRAALLIPVACGDLDRAALLGAAALFAV